MNIDTRKVLQGSLVLTQGGRKVNGMITITEAAKIVGVSPKTIVRWELSGKVKRSKRDWRGWRVYDRKDIKRLKQFRDMIVYK